MSGIAIKGISKVPLENLFVTAYDLYGKILRPIGYTKADWSLIGSSGKKLLSGDIDVALKYSAIPNLSKESAAIKICDLASSFGMQTNNRVYSGFSMVHLGSPISGMSDHICQIDIMLVDDLNYAKFKYWAPFPSDSKYNGATRSMLLNAILKEVSLSPVPGTSDEDLVPYFVDGIEYSPYIQYQHCAMGPDNFVITQKTYRGVRGFLKNPKKIGTIDLGQDPEPIINKLFFENKIHVNDVNGLCNSFESLWECINSFEFAHSDKVFNIVKTFIRLLNGANSWQYTGNSALPLPTEIIDYAAKRGIEIESINSQNSYQEA